MAIETRSTAAASAAPRDRGRGARRHQHLSHAERCDPVADRGALPHDQAEPRARLPPDRAYHLHLHLHRIAAPALGGLRHRPLPHALFARARHGLFAAGPDHRRFRFDLRLGVGRRRPDRHGILGVSSRVLARRPPRVRRSARPRPIGVPGRRQFRHGARSAARGLRRAALWTGKRRLVLHRRADRHDHACRHRLLVWQDAEIQQRARCDRARAKRSTSLRTARCGSRSPS